MTANPRPNQDDLNQTSAQRGSDTLHSRVYALLIGFAAWFALAVWSFAGSGVTDYLLVIVSGFIIISSWRCNSSYRASGAPTTQRRKSIISRHCAIGRPPISRPGKTASAARKPRSTSCCRLLLRRLA